MAAQRKGRDLMRVSCDHEGRHLSCEDLLINNSNQFFLSHSCTTALIVDCETTFLKKNIPFLSERESRRLFSVCTIITRLNCEIEDWDTCNLSTDNLCVNQAGCVYTEMLQRCSSQDSLPQLIGVDSVFTFSVTFFWRTTKGDLCVHLSASHLLLCMTSDLSLDLFSRNSRMWTGMSTTQICPLWPRRPPRAARTSTSCRSPRCPCRSPSNLLDQVGPFLKVKAPVFEFVIYEWNWVDTCTIIRPKKKSLGAIP